MLVLEYLIGGLLQTLGCLGLAWVFTRFTPRLHKSPLKQALLSFALSQILEATVLSSLSFIYLLQPTLLKAYFLLKAFLGATFLYQQRNVVLPFLKQHLHLLVLFLYFLITCLSPPH